jgi:hypothetical protein
LVLTGGAGDSVAPHRLARLAQRDAPTRMIWWVDYERVDTRDARAPARSTLASELRLAEGEFDLPPG